MVMRWLLRLYLFWFAVGTVLLTVGWMPEWLRWSNPVFLYLAGAVGASLFIRAYGRLRGVAITVTVALGATVLEGVGVHTGLLFGAYRYTDWLGPQVFCVPVAIGTAWVMVVATSHFALRHAVQGWPLPVAGATLAVALDLLLDPVAAAKGYWIWEQTGNYYGIPWTNFSGWFVTAWLLHTAVVWLVQRSDAVPSHAPSRDVESDAFLLLFTVAALFSCLSLQTGYQLPVLFCLIPWSLAYWLKGRKSVDSSREKAMV